MITENDIWQTHFGDRIKLKDLSDTHLANVIDYVSKIRSYNTELISVLKQIQKDRGLKDEFINRSQIPYKNPNGKWEIFDFEKREFIEVEV